MPLVSDILADKVEIEATIDGYEFLDWTQLQYKAIVNKARVLTFTVAGTEALQRCRIGAKVFVEAGRGNQIHNLTFKGIIKFIRPGPSISQVIAIDYITNLTTSELKEYTANDIVGNDLYYLAARECDYGGVGISTLTEGSGIIATPDMALGGFLTRKQFIDKCFSFLISEFNDVDHEALSFIPWHYAIRANAQMDFFFVDYLHKQAAPVFTVSEADDNLTGKGIVAQIDTTQMVNSVTCVSKNNSDKFVTYTNEFSKEQFGPHSKLITHDSDLRDRLEVVARA